jgi:hypothetical protein
MSLNHETLAWLVQQERSREIQAAERARLVTRIQTRRTAGGVRRAIGRRVIRFGASLAGLQSTELGQPARTIR